MKARDLRRRTSADLREEAKKLGSDVFQRRFKSSTEETTDRGFVRKARRDVARVLSVLRERELGLSKEPSGGKD
jgi:large subunit ribosomal protein L29